MKLSFPLSALTLTPRVQIYRSAWVPLLHDICPLLLPCLPVPVDLLAWHVGFASPDPDPEGRTQYVSLRRTLGVTLQHQGWKVEQISFIAGSRSLNEQDLRKNLKFFRVPEASIETIGSKLAMKIFDEYANILRCMYSTRFNGDPFRTGSSHEDNPTPQTPTPSLLRSLESGRPDKFRRRTKGTKGGKDT